MLYVSLFRSIWYIFIDNVVVCNLSLGMEIGFIGEFFDFLIKNEYFIVLLV